MYLSKVEIRNFRCLRDLSVTLTPGLNVLAGENNIGKTAVFDAIRVALGPASVTGDVPRLTKEDRHRGPDGAYHDAPITIKLHFSGLSIDQQAQFIDILNFEPSAPDKSTAQINFQWTWNEKSERYSARRWGGAAEASENGVPEDVLQIIPMTMLGALRDAATGLLPGKNSKVATLLQARADDPSKATLVDFVIEANKELKKQPLVSDTEALICKTLESVSGSVLAQKASIETAEPNFDRIVQSLRLVLRRENEGNPLPILDEIASNGLGYNNLLFLATVVLELNTRKNALLPLLFVEEPEAHLHPQLQTMLADFLADPKLQRVKVQTVASSHSPTLVAYVPPESLRILHRSVSGDIRCSSIAEFNLAPEKLNQLRRMFDVTKASLLFAKAAILVEGITEALLLPILARRAGFDLEKNAVAVVPICGVDFETIAQLFGEERLHNRIAIVTDGDPGVEEDEEEESDDEKTKAVPWNERVPNRDKDGSLKICARVAKLCGDYKDNSVVKIFNSDVTLEYSLANAGTQNPKVLCDVWKGLFVRTPKTLNDKILSDCNGDHANEVLAVWRGICLAKTTRSKGEFAQALAAALDEKNPDGSYSISKSDFVVSEYLVEAFKHVLPK